MFMHKMAARKQKNGRPQAYPRRIVRSLTARSAILLVAFAALPAAAQKLPAGCPPKTPKDNVVDVLHGVRVPDPYRWLEAQSSPATRKWIAAEDRCTTGVLDTLPGREDISEELGKLMRTEAVGVPIERHDRFFYMKRAADQDLSLIYMRQGVDGEPELLSSCYRTCLKMAEERKVASISFPSISTGVYGYPFEPAARIAITTVRAATREFTGIAEVIFCCHSAGDLAIYQRLLGQSAA